MNKVIEVKEDELGRKLYMYECAKCGFLVKRRKLVTKGKVLCNDCKSHRLHAMVLYHPEEVDTIRQMYYEGATYKMIAEALHTCDSNIYAKIKEMRDEGLLDEKVREEIKTRIAQQKKLDKAAAEKKPVEVKKKEVWVQPEGTVWCDRKTSAKCKYGSANFNFRCRYCDVTSMPRGCSWKACNKFEEGVSENAEEDESFLYESM